jgi:putative Mg2+ transporter-C (MgtC) family protein
MAEYWYTQLDFLLKLALSGVCGAVIGYERKNRLKEAGIRTHMLVALGAALMMIISKYGFSDLLHVSGYSLDPSRIAAQIVSGIGFLGAGMIFVRNQSINGLTTAAGIWATAGIGMAIGASLYFAGIAATVLVFIVQVLLHRNFRWIKIPVARQVLVRTAAGMDSVALIRDRFSRQCLEIIDLKARKTEGGLLELDLFVKLPPDFEIAQLLNLFDDDPRIRQIECCRQGPGPGAADTYDKAGGET